MKKSLFISALVLTLMSTISIAVTVISIIVTTADTPEYILSLLIYGFISQLWWIVALVAGVLGLLSFKVPKVRAAGMVLGLLFAVRMAVDLVSCLIYGLLDVTILGALLRLAVVVWFVISALKAE